MWIDRTRFECLQETVKYLDKRLDLERDARYALERKFNELTAHLGLKFETVYQHTKIVKAKS